MHILTLISVLMVAAAAQNSDQDKQSLDPARQKEIWDAEHVTFKLEKRFGKWFLDGLRKRNAEILAAAFHKEFSGSVIADKAPLEKLSKSHVEEVRRSAEDRPANAGEVAAALLTQLRSVDKIENLSLRVLQIAAAGEGKWETRLLLTATGRGARGAVTALESQHTVGFQTKTNADFNSGAVVSSWKILSEIRRTSPQMLMEEVTEASQLHRLPLTDNWKMPKEETALRYSFQFAVEDFDRDGYLDIAIASVRGPTALLKSLGGQRFAVANQAFGLPMMATKAERALACWLDFDNDGFPDLILGDRVYRNVGGKKFVEITTESGLEFPLAPMGCSVADYDGDGLCDLYVLYQGTVAGDEPLPWVGDDISGAPNVLWKNLGGGRFKDVTAESKASTGKRNSFAATWLYADGDALPDLYVANDFGANNLLRNKGDGSFEEIAQENGAADFATSMGVASGDLDNDGSPEIYVANMYSKMGRRIIGQVSEDDYGPGVYKQIKGACAGNRLYKRGPDGGQYKEWSEPWGINDIGWAYAPAIADLNNDGLLDLHATTGFLSFDRSKPDG
ncbi:MAG: VCBS repeat-containing protein [Akkermansiaceae bacterium]